MSEAEKDTGRAREARTRAGHFCPHRRHGYGGGQGQSRRQSRTPTLNLMTGLLLALLALLAVFNLPWGN